MFGFTPSANFGPREARRLALAFVGFGGVGLLVLVGARLFGVTGPVVQAWLAGFDGSVWALPVAIGAFALLAFVGAPQFVLIAAAVAAFGPLRGAAFSWAGTLVSAGLGFALGRRLAGQLLTQSAAPGVRRFVGMVGRKGMMASLVVRLVPAAPFVLINMAAGATPMPLVDFLVGTAVGIVPKIAITALGAAGMARGAEGGEGAPLIIAALALWIFLGLAARRWARGWNISD